MNVQDLCTLLVNRRLQEIQAATGFTDSIPEDVFAEALTPDWLKDNVAEVFNTMNNPESRENALVGNLEINAFLGAFQRAYENQTRGRLSRWAAALSQTNRAVTGDGALILQLRKIGVAVDDEFITNIVFANPQEAV